MSRNCSGGNERLDLPPGACAAIGRDGTGRRGDPALPRESGPGRLLPYGPWPFLLRQRYAEQADLGGRHAAHPRRFGAAGRRRRGGGGFARELAGRSPRSALQDRSLWRFRGLPLHPRTAGLDANRLHRSRREIACRSPRRLASRLDDVADQLALVRQRLAGAADLRRQSLRAFMVQRGLDQSDQPPLVGVDFAFDLAGLGEQLVEVEMAAAPEGVEQDRARILEHRPVARVWDLPRGQDQRLLEGGEGTVRVGTVLPAVALDRPQSREAARGVARE